MTVHNLRLPDGLTLCAETFGDPTDQTVVLVHGASASMLWWDATLCQDLARSGRFVVRYDQRDTGCSTSYPVGAPGYTQGDLAADVLGLMDRLGRDRAHLVGCSAGGSLVMRLGLDHPHRFPTLTLLSSSSGDPSLPPPTAAFPSSPDDLSDPATQVEALLDQVRACDEVSPHYDEAAARALVEADLARAGDLRPALVNHFLVEAWPDDPGRCAGLTQGVLVLHGDLDPVFPLPHGEALARCIPRARLEVLPAQGHDLLPHNWDCFVRAIRAHTA